MTPTIEYASMRTASATRERQRNAKETVAAMKRDESEQQLTISMLGTTAMLFEAPGALDLPAQRRIWSLAREVETWPGIR